MRTIRRTQGCLALRASPTSVCAHLGVAVLLANVSLTETAGAKTFIDYLKPAPITCSPLSSATWGVAGVRPRDICNGIESAKGADVPPDYYYWDGKIIRATDGTYHMFMSTWSGSAGFNPGWLNSDAYHAISEQGVLGPYKRQDYVYSNSGSHKGHNVSALELPDGTYAVIVSETVPFTIYKSSSLDGPWTGCTASIQANGISYTDGNFASNVSLIPRHDGKFQIVQRHGHIGIADTLCGPYKLQKPTWDYPAANRPSVDSIYPKRTSIPGVSNPTYAWEEDPHIWYSGGVYHVLYSGSGDRVGWHLYSPDGINKWKDGGLSCNPRLYQQIFCYEGSTTCNQWYKMERPSVVLQDGHVTHVTWAVSDVDKDNQIPGNSNHGSKVIVIPFDGVAFDADTGAGGSAGAGAGGASSTGGPSGTGGTRASGGSSTAGGSKATGGTSGSRATGGLTSRGGSQATRGATGGNATTGGVAHTSSGGETAASNATGGTLSSMGGTGAGGQSSDAPAIGGMQASGGLVGAGGIATSTVPPGPPTSSSDVSDPSSCGCRIVGRDSSSKSLAIFGVLGLLILRPRRRRTIP